MPEPSRKLDILIVEDDLFLRKILTTKFTQDGFGVRFSGDGEEALKAIQEKVPDIILLDLILPKLSGFEVLADLRTNPKTKDVTVVVLSNLGQDEDKERAKELGAERFLVKADHSINEVMVAVKETYAMKSQSKR